MGRGCHSEPKAKNLCIAGRGSCAHTVGVRSGLSYATEILRELHREMADLPAGHITLLAHPDIAGLLIDEERCGLDELEQRHGRQISINPRPGYHIEQFEIAVG